MYSEKPRDVSVKDEDLICQYRLVRRDSSDPNVPAIPKLCESFAGVGGVSHGFEQAGMDLSVLIEKDPLAAASLRHCHRKADVISEGVDIALYRAKKQHPAYMNILKADHVHASPPCQGFSDANRNKEPSVKDLENQALSDTFINLVDLVNAKTASYENVPGILRKGKPQLQNIILHLLLAGYHDVCLANLNAKHFGDPQSRNRTVCIASKLNDHFHLPERTHDNNNIKTVGNALGDLEDVNPQPGSGIVTLEGGKTISNHCEYIKLTDKNRRHFEQLDWDKPAPTITTSRRFIHPTKDRSLTLREYARLKGFPDTKIFDGTRANILRQIGNAVPVGLSTAIGRSIMHLYDKAQPISAESSSISSSGSDEYDTE